MCEDERESEKKKEKIGSESRHTHRTGMTAESEMKYL